jgi:Tfp pilus assembly protein PilF
MVATIGRMIDEPPESLFASCRERRSRALGSDPKFPGFMLLEANKANDALIAFDKAIAKEPNRFLALYGAGQAAQKAGQKSRAKRYYRQIADIAKDATSDRPELVVARKNAR